MREAMANAEVGDDMSGEDPTVNRLESLCATKFGKEAAVFACSGTQSNQMAVRTHCRPGDELLCHETGHIVNFEAGAPAALSGVSCRTLAGDGGMIDLPQLRGKVRSGDQHLACTRLVCLENTTNIGGGRAYPLEQIERVAAWAHELGLKVHMDGAAPVQRRRGAGLFAQGRGPARRHDLDLFLQGAWLSDGIDPRRLGRGDTLGPPRRKLFGGALRQAGIVAAAALYALEHNVERLSEDHRNAKQLAELIAGVQGLPSRSMRSKRTWSFLTSTRPWGMPASFRPPWRAAACGFTTRRPNACGPAPIWTFPGKTSRKWAE